MKIDVIILGDFLAWPLAHSEHSTYVSCYIINEASPGDSTSEIVLDFLTSFAYILPFHVLKITSRSLISALLDPVVVKSLEAGGRGKGIDQSDRPLILLGRSQHSLCTD
jgi:hypothetical protein